MLGDAKLASDFADEMLKRGIYVIGFSYPVVPKDQARIRVQISGAHTAEDIDRTVEAFVEVGKKMKVVWFCVVYFIKFPTILMEGFSYVNVFVNI